MTIIFRCEKCDRRYEVDDRLAGRRARCKQCRAEFTIPVPRMSVSRASEPAPVPDIDRFGLEEGEAGGAPPRPLEADEEFAPPSSAGKFKRKKKRKGPDAGMAWLVLAGLAVVAVAAVAAMTTTAGAVVVGIVVGFLAFGLMMVGSILCLIVPFREDITCGLLYLFLPFYSLYYLITRWEEMKKPFLISLIGTALLFGDAIFLPALNARRHAAARPQVAQRAPYGPDPAEPIFPEPRPIEATPSESEPSAAQDEAADVGPATAIEPVRPARSAYEQHERLIKEVPAQLDELADLLATITDVPSARAAIPRIKAIMKPMLDVERRASRLPRLTLEEDRQLQEAYMDAVTASGERCEAEIKRVRSIAGVGAVLDREMREFRPPLRSSFPRPIGPRRSNIRRPGVPRQPAL